MSYNKPYTYHIKCPNGKQYYGYRYSNKVSPSEDLWKVYFTSSKLVKELREQVRDDSQFVATVDKVFETAADARAYEEKYLRENNCVESDDWLNRVNYGHKWHYRAETEEERHALSEKKKKYYKENPHPWTGRKHSEETKEKIRAIRTGTKATEEAKRNLSAAMSGSGNGMYGRKHSEETIEKIRAKAKGRKGLRGKDNPMYGKTPWNKGKIGVFTEETRRKMSENMKKYYKENPHPMTGRKHSEETKMKLSESRKGRGGRKGKDNPMYGKTPWNKGKRHTEESKRKMSEAVKKRHAAKKAKSSNNTLERFFNTESS
jgi:hypothetical protein